MEFIWEFLMLNEQLWRNIWIHGYIKEALL